MTEADHIRIRMAAERAIAALPQRSIMIQTAPIYFSTKPHRPTPAYLMPGFALALDLRVDAGIMWRQRRKRWSRICTRAAETIEAGKTDHGLASELRDLATFSQGKGRAGLAEKLFAAAKAVA